jgi:acetyltransferase-like isoleucine patch superfamily enzyme
MLRQILRFTWSLASTLKESLREPTAANLWLAEARKKSLVHPSIEFKGLGPDGSNFTIGRTCCLERDLSVWLSNDHGAEPKLSIGDSVYVGRNTFLGCYKPISIGDHTMIGAYSYIISGDHRFDRRDVPMHDQGYVGRAVVIGSDAWLGTHVTVLPGVTIGEGAIVGAGSVVTKNIPEFEIWAGVPAKHIRHRP